MEGNTIDLFMWGYQQHAQISFQVSAESLFNKLDRTLTPQVFFFGLLTEDRNDRHQICLEPEDCGFHPKMFTEIKSIASELQKLDEENMVSHSHPIAQTSHEKKINNRAYVNALLKLLIRFDAHGKNKYYVSGPVPIDGFLVFTVLSLNREAIGNYYSLSKEKVNDRFKIFRSLIESAIEVYLNECCSVLKDPNNAFDGTQRYADELMRSAGKQLMYTAAAAGRNFKGLHALYDACNEIASMKYEGAVKIGNLIIAPRNHKNVKVLLHLKNPIKIRDYRTVRKFLEVADRDSSLICDSAFIYGLGEMRGKYNPVEESIFVVRFTSHFRWELLHDNNPLMEVEYREPTLPKEKINREKFYSDFPRIFRGIDKTAIDDVWEVAIEATKRHMGQ